MEVRAVDVVAENGRAGGVVDVELGDLVSVGECDGVAGADAIGQPRRRLAAARWRGAEQFLPIFQPDAAVERCRAIRGREHGDCGAGGRTALDVGECGERTAIGAVALDRPAGADEPSSLIPVAAALAGRLRGGGHDDGESTREADRERQLSHLPASYSRYPGWIRLQTGPSLEALTGSILSI